ncbi:MAG: DUF47 family protein [Chloroflexota bacterium]
MPKFSFLPHEESFFPLYEKSASNAVSAANLLKDMVYECTDLPGKADKLSEIDQASGKITHDIIVQLHSTFVTPFDREDMAKLADSLNDIVDYIEGAATRMSLYRAECPVGKARELADVIVKCTSEVEEAIFLLNKKDGFKQIMGKCAEIHQLEYEADCVFRAADAELFNNTTDLLYVMKWHQIYQFMEDATDRCDDVATVLEGVALKHV